MIEAKAYPLDDTGYLAKDLRRWNKVFSTGVFPNEDNFKTTTNNDMSVSVSTGDALFNDDNGGLSFWTESVTTLQVETANGTLPRIDAVALRRDKVENKAYILIKTGTPSINPYEPTIERDSSKYEVYIALIYVPAGSTAVSASNITDTRTNETYCGYIRSRAEKLPTSMLYEQYKQSISDFRKALEDVGSLIIPDHSVTLEKLASTLLDRLYPIGKLWISEDSTNPATVLGFGIWEQTGQGRMLIGEGTFIDKNGETRTFDIGQNATGEYYHKLSVEELPWTTWVSDSSLTANVHINVQNNGSNNMRTQSNRMGRTHENLSPEYVVYFYKRIA